MPDAAAKDRSESSNSRPPTNRLVHTTNRMKHFLKEKNRVSFIVLVNRKRYLTSRQTSFNPRHAKPGDTRKHVMIRADTTHMIKILANWLMTRLAMTGSREEQA